MEAIKMPRIAAYTYTPKKVQVLTMPRITRMLARRMGHISKYSRPSPRAFTPVQKLLDEETLFSNDMCEAVLWAVTACSGAGGEDPPDHGKDVRFHSDHEREIDGKKGNGADLSEVDIELQDLVPMLNLDMNTDENGEFDSLVQTFNNENANVSTMATANTEAAAVAAAFDGVPSDHQGLSHFSVTHLGISRGWIGNEDKPLPSQPLVDAAQIQESPVVQDASSLNEIRALTSNDTDSEKEVEDAHMAKFTTLACRQFAAAFSATHTNNDDEEDSKPQDLDSFLASEDINSAFFSSMMLSSLLISIQELYETQEFASAPK